MTHILAWIRGAAVGTVTSLFVACTPLPPDRRVSKFGKIYWGAKYMELAAETQTVLARQLPEDVSDDALFVVAAEFVFPRPKKTILSVPKPDVDNLLKLPLDAITKTQRVWADDTQIATVVSTKRWSTDGETAGVHIHIARI